MVALAVASACPLAPAAAAALIRQAGEGMACAWNGGEDISDIAHEWSASVGNAHGIQDASAMLIKNPEMVLSTQAQNRASQMLHAIRTSPRHEVLYRGMEISRAEAAKLAKKATFKLPISSFSADKAVAQEFAALGLGDVSVMIEVHGAKGLDISSWVLEEFRYQREFLVSEKFRVFSMTRTENSMTIILEAR